MNKNLLFAALLFTCRGFSQCPASVTLRSTDSCSGTLLQVTSPNYPSKIKWFRNDSLVYTATAHIRDSGITVAGGNGYGSAANQFSDLNYAYVDSVGNLYVVDASNNRIQKWTPGATSGITVAGGNGPGSANNQLNEPGYVQVDAQGNIFVLEYFNNRIQKWAPGETSGITVVGGNPPGVGTGQLDHPVSFFLDKNGNFYISELYNYRVQKWAPGATSGITVAGGNGQGPAANQFTTPGVVFVDSSGNVYVTDITLGRVQKWAPGATTGITVAGGNGIGSDSNQLNYPNSVLVDKQGNIFVGDNENNRVQKWAPGATSGTTVAFGGFSLGSAANQFYYMGNISMDIHGNLFIPDGQNSRVQEWVASADTFYAPPTGGTYKAIVTDQKGCVIPSNRIKIRTSVTPAVNITVSGNVPCSDARLHFNAQSVNGGNRASYQWQVNGVNTGGADGPNYTNSHLNAGDVVTCILTSNASCAHPSGVTSNAITVFGSPTGILKSQGGNCLGSRTLLLSSSSSLSKIIWLRDNAGVDTATQHYGPYGMNVAGGNGNGNDSTQLLNAEGVYADGSGNVYVADTYNNRVQKWAPGATFGITVAGGNGYGNAPNQLASPLALQQDASGNLYILEWGNKRIQKWAPGATSGTTVLGDDGSGSGAGQLSGPNGFYLDNSGNIYIAEGPNNRIQKWAPGATSGITVAGGNGDGDAANQFSGPSGVFVDRNGNVYVSDANNDRVMKWAPGATSGVIVAGGNGHGGAPNQVTNPQGLNVDTGGNIFVCEQSAWRVQRWAPGATSGETVAGITIDGPGPEQLSYPMGLWLTANGDIYIADVNNYRVMKWSLSSPDSVYSPTEAGTYKAMLTNNQGCTATSNAVKIKPSVIPAVSINTPDSSICEGKRITFSATPVEGGKSPAYQWQVNGVNTGSNSRTFSSHTLTTGDSVTCSMISNAACADTNAVRSNSIPIIVNPNPQVISGQPITLTPGQTTVLSLQITGDISQYRWTPGTGLSDNTVANPVASPSETTLYTLQVWTAAGCEASGKIKVEVGARLRIPNAFTPNGDGKNEIFYVLGVPEGSSIRDFVIFNRNSQKLFQVHDVPAGDPSFGWNGMAGGVPVPTGTYVYEVVLRFADGRQEAFRGTVLLKR